MQTTTKLIMPKHQIAFVIDADFFKITLSNLKSKASHFLLSLSFLGNIIQFKLLDVYPGIVFMDDI